MMFGGDGGAKNLELALSRWTVPSVDVGLATGGTNTTVDDTRQNWTVNKWAGGHIKIIKADGSQYSRDITANTATRITFAALPGATVVAAGDLYIVRSATSPVDVTDRAARLLGVITSITQWAGVALTARDISLDLANLAKLPPLAKATIFNAALPAAEAGWLGADIAPTNSPSFLRLYVCVAAAGIFRVARTVGGVTVAENMNAGNALVANAGYLFDVEWRAGDTLNFRYSVTGANILCFRADEVGAAV